jgi:hypothetical protein
MFRRRRMRERNLAGLDHLDAEEREEVIEAAEHNPDETTRREAIEQELMELGRSKEGEEIGD